MQTHCNRLSSLTTKLGTDSITDGNDKKLYTQTKKISYQQRVNLTLHITKMRPVLRKVKNRKAVMPFVAAQFGVKYIDRSGFTPL